MTPMSFRVATVIKDEGTQNLARKGLTFDEVEPILLGLAAKMRTGDQIKLTIRPRKKVAIEVLRR